MGAIGDPYATLALIKTRIGEQGSAYDTALTNAVNAASQSIEGITGRQFNTDDGRSGSGAGVTYTATTVIDTGGSFYAAQVGQVVTSTVNTATITAVTDATHLVTTTWAPGTPSAAAAYSIPAISSARVYYPDRPDIVVVEDFSTVSGLVVALDYGNDGVYETTLTSTNYQVEPMNGVYDGSPGWPFWRIRAINQYYPLWWGAVGSPRASIQVTAHWGWTAVPTPVVEACLVLAEEIFKVKDAPFGVAGFDVQGFSLRVKENPKVMALLSRYMRQPIQIA